MRISRDQMLMEMAETTAKRSTCSRAQVGVVIARDARVLVTGYNGAPTGLDHCSHDCDCKLPSDHLPHSSWCNSLQGCQVAIHAEANAIAYAARWGISIEGCSVYTTLSPCVPCSQLLVAAGVTRVLSLHEYRDRAGIEFLQAAGVQTS